MNDPAPFVLIPSGDGGFEFRAFSDDSENPIVLRLDEEERRRLGIAVADVLTAIDAPDVEPQPVSLEVDGRIVTLIGDQDGGLRITVSRAGHR